MNDPIIGIDLGTTNSEVAIVENGKVTVIADGEQRIIPSVVGLADDGAILVGVAAQNQYALYPERTVKSVKRLMGQDSKLQLGDNDYLPQEISAIILKRLKKIAESYLQKEVKKAVITVPAYFSDAQRQATREAGEIAGLDVVRMINEPTAAAFAYEGEEARHKNVLVYDLGGGTFDVSVVSLQNSVVEVLTSHGNNHLGGDDFDNKIMTVLMTSITEQGGDIAEDSKALARLRQAAEKAKIKLSDHPYAMVEEEYITTVNKQPLHLSYELKRDDYEELINAYVDETLESVHIALDGAKLSTADINEVLLVGGSTRTPLIHRRLKDIFGLQPHAEINPDLCVATGAAMQAATIAGEAINTVLVDVTPYTFGTSALAERDGEFYPFVYVPIIEKNSSLPVNKSELFFTASEGQTKIEINVYQGEDSDALNNISIGQFVVEGLSDVDQGNPIIISLALDLDGILKVTALEKVTGLQKTITIDNVISRFDEEEIQQAQGRIQALFNAGENFDSGDVVDVANTNNKSESKPHQQTVQGQALVDKAKTMLDDANDDDREDLVNSIEVIHDAINESDQQALALAIGELSDLIYYIET